MDSPIAAIIMCAIAFYFILSGYKDEYDSYKKGQTESNFNTVFGGISPKVSVYLFPFLILFMVIAFLINYLI